MKSVPEAMDPRAFILDNSPFFEFKAKLEELGWKYRGVQPVPTVYGITVDEHRFTGYCVPQTLYGGNEECDYRLYVSEFIKDGKYLLQAYGEGHKERVLNEVNIHGESLTEDVDWDINEQEQDPAMSGSEFAEIMSAEAFSNHGPELGEDG